MIRSTLNNGANGLAQVVDWLLDAAKRDPRLPAAASVHVLNLFGTVMGGYEMARRRLPPSAGSMPVMAIRASFRPRSRLRASTPSRSCRGQRRWCRSLFTVRSP